MDIRKIKGKKGLLTRDFIIAYVLFSGVVALFVLAIAGISQEYDTNILTSEDFQENYNKLTESTGGIETARKAASDTGGLSFIGTFDVAFQSTFTFIQMIFSTLDLLGDVTGNFAADFGLDSNVVSIAFQIGLSILTIIIVSIWISSISRGRL
ncbi:MAG: hypothetical protein ACTSQ4_02445 [Candidatus Heimdallarchaeaceae archaeon]